MNRNQLLLLIAITAALLLTRIALYAPEEMQHQAEPPQALQQILLSETHTLRDFNLHDQNGQPFTLQQLQGKWSFVFIGYTHCPDICPTTLAILKGVAKQLEATPEISADTRFIFVSVDPKRDIQTHLKEYIGYFNPEFIAATGKPEEIDKLVRSLGAVYMFEGDTDSESYIVNHSASVALIDPQGQWVARFNPPHTVPKFSSNYLLLRNFLEQH